MSVLWRELTETAAETSLVNLNTEVDGREELLLFATMANYLYFYRGFITIHVDFLSEISDRVQHWNPSKIMIVCHQRGYWKYGHDSLALRN